MYVYYPRFWVGFFQLRKLYKNALIKLVCETLSFAEASLVFAYKYACAFYIMRGRLGSETYRDFVGEWNRQSNKLTFIPDNPAEPCGPCFSWQKKTREGFMATMSGFAMQEDNLYGVKKCYSASFASRHIITSPFTRCSGGKGCGTQQKISTTLAVNDVARYQNSTE